MILTPHRLEALRGLAEGQRDTDDRARARRLLDAAGIGWREPPRRPPIAPGPPDWHPRRGASTFSASSSASITLTRIGPSE